MQKSVLILLLTALLFTATGCSRNYHIGAAAGTVGVGALGAITGGGIGLLAAGGGNSDKTGLLVLGGAIIGALAGGALGYGAGSAVDETIAR